MEQISLERIRDPIYKDIPISDFEKELIRTRPFQRLRYIRQLGFVYLPYPGATHTRFGHSLGTMHVAGLLSHTATGLNLSEDKIEEIRIEGLLHELGALPFSYSFSDVIEKHCPRKEIMTQRIICDTKVNDIVSRKFDVQTIAELSSGVFLLENKNRKDVEYWILFSVIGANSIDFLLRDSYFTGVAYGKVDLFRLLANLDWVGNRPNVENENLRDIIFSFFLARRQMNSSVSFHFERRIADKMMCKIIESEIKHSLLDPRIFTQLDEYLELDDESLWMKLEEPLKEKEGERKTRILYETLKDLKHGKIFRRIQLDVDQDEQQEGWKEILLDPKKRRENEETIASELNFQPEQVILDSPLLYTVRYFGRGYEPEDVFLKEIPQILKEKITLEEKQKVEGYYVYVPRDVQKEEILAAAQKCLRT